MDVSILLGKTITKIAVIDDTQIHIWTNDDKHYLFYHEQDCCETVSIEDIAGDLKNLIGNPLTMAEVAVNHGTKKDYDYEEDDRDSETWSFYKFATIKGYVTIRWYGESNGCYSEEVNFEEIHGNNMNIPYYTSKIDFYS